MKAPLPSAFLLDWDVPFSASTRLRSFVRFEPFPRAVPLRFAVLKSSLWGLALVVLGLLLGAVA